MYLYYYYYHFLLCACETPRKCHFLSMLPVLCHTCACWKLRTKTFISHLCACLLEICKRNYPKHPQNWHVRICRHTHTCLFTHFKTLFRWFTSISSQSITDVLWFQLDHIASVFVSILHQMRIRTRLDSGNIKIFSKWKEGKKWDGRRCVEGKPSTLHKSTASSWCHQHKLLTTFFESVARMYVRCLTNCQ